MAVSRLNSGNNQNADIWGPPSGGGAGTIPNGNISLDGNSFRHITSPNSGRVLIIFYCAEPGGAASWSPTITVGGQSPDYSYTNIHDLGNDNVTGVWIWMESTIQNFTGYPTVDYAISTGGTWPSTTSEQWAVQAFMNVDQTVEPTVNYQEDASSTSLSLDTTSDADDVILALICGDVSTGSITTADTLAILYDANATDCRFVICEGMGGDNTTTITCSSANWASYAIRLKYKKYALNMIYRDHPQLESSSNAGFTDPSTGDAELSSNVFSPNRTYIHLCRNLYNQNSTSTNVFDGQINIEGGAQIPTSGIDNNESRYSSTPYGHQYFYIGEYTAPTIAGGWYTGDGDMQWRFRSDGVQTVYTKEFIQCAFDTSDMDAGDYYFVDDTTGYTALDNTGWTDTASQTLGDGTSDWVFFYAVKVTVDSTSASIRVRLTIDDVVVGNQYIEAEGEDSNENWWIGGMATADAVAASSSVVVECQTDSSTAGLMDVQYARLFALRLDQFEDHFTDYDAAGATISSVDTDTLINSVAHTTDTAAAAAWVVGAFSRGDDHGENTKTIAIDLRDGTGTGDRICCDTTYSQCGHGANDRYALGPIWGIDDNVADATSKTYRVYGNEENDVTPAVGIDEQWMFGFSMVFAPEAAAGGEQAGSLLSVGVGY
jgi:hypothetical protein